MYTSSSPYAVYGLFSALTLMALGCGFHDAPLQVDEEVPGPGAFGGATGGNAGSSGSSATNSGGGHGGSSGSSGASGAGGSTNGGAGLGGGASAGQGGSDGTAGDDAQGGHASIDPPLDAGTDAGPDIPEPVFGASCGGAQCPPVPAGNEQCCTVGDDVSALRARETERCGIQFPTGDACFELEQPGVLDDTCPADLAEPGCCTPEGRCGTVNGAEGIGCHVDGALEQSCGGSVDDTKTCETSGWFAIQALVDVTWGGRSGALFDLTDDGRGTIVVDLLAKIPEVDDQGNFDSEIRACAATLPPFVSSTLCEHYQPVFATRVWDSDAAPTFAVAGRYECDNPGCTLAFEGWNGLVGIELEDPDGAWPSASEATTFSCGSGEGLDCYPDHDGDGHPGIRVELLTSGTSPGTGNCSQFYTRAAPLNANPFAIIGGVRRTDRIDVGVRLRMGATGRLADDCSGAEGIGLAEFVQSRAARCMVQEGTRNPFQTAAGANTACSSTELAFVNQSLPDYDALALGEKPNSALSLSDESASEGPRYRIVRLHDVADPATCADARDALDLPP